MKSIYLSIPLVASALLCGSCESQLDIVPKGQTTLERTADLELLLNQVYNLGIYPYDNIGQICGESVSDGYSIPEMMANTNTLKYAYLAYEESVDRVTLAQEDARYSATYKYINYLNTLLAKIDDASGLDERKPQLKAEAKVLRAYFHWLTVVMHAGQFTDAAAAEEMGGIAYVTDIDNTAVKEKLSLAETYRLILEDCSEEVIALLPEGSTDVCRPGREFGYAVRGRVLMQMKRYDEALPYLEKSLAINSYIDDRAYIRDRGEWVLDRTDPSNLLYVGAGPLVCPTMEILSRESYARFEKSDYVYRYCGTVGWDLGYGKMYSGLDGYPMCMSWTVQGNPYGMTSVRTMLSAAECRMRTGDIGGGIEYLDRVRKAHVENATPYAMMHQMIPFNLGAAMRLLQQTKWIESLGSYENFFDMKRWNTEPEFSTTLSKDLDLYGTVTLAPESPLWVLPFPANATRYNSTLTQNF